MIKANIVIGANEEEYNSIYNTVSFFTDLRNDIEEYNIPIDSTLLKVIENVESGLNFLWFNFGIELVD